MNQSAQPLAFLLQHEGDESEDDEPADEQATAVEVTVRRRETERQQQARLRSYSYIQQEEEQEAWVSLKVHAQVGVPEFGTALGPLRQQ